MSKIDVCLIAHTPDPDNVVYMAAKTCYSKEVDYLADHSTSNRAKLIRSVVASGHTSILEHVSYSFGITGVSRVFLAQVTRHRVGVAFSVRSMRYVDLTQMELDDMYYPTSDKVPFTQSYHQSLQDYQRLVDHGVPKEDARYVLPNGAPSPMMLTMNTRELLHYFSLRCCERAQTEHRIVANKMLNLAKTTSEVIFEKAGPSCVLLGYCPEGTRSCGKAPTLDELLTAYKETHQ